MKVRTRRSILAVVLTLALMVPTALAAPLNGDIDAAQEQTKGYTYTAPTSPMEVDDNIVTATAHRAASPVLGMMGVNAVSGFGMINGGAPTDLAAAEASPAVGIWGSSINENPDPYYWNYFYNFYAAEKGLALAEDALMNPGVSASPIQADKTLFEEYGNVSVSLSTRPDIVIGCASTGNGSDTNGYDDQLATIRSFTSDSPYYQEGDENYSPKLISYQTTYIKQMIESVYRIADAISEVEAETGKTTRYGDVQKIAQDYENYVYGTIGYVLSELEAKGLDKKVSAVVTAINEDGTYTLADSVSTSATSLVRAYEYSMTVTDSLTDEIGGATATLDQLLGADVIITFNNSNITQNALFESFGDKVYDGIVISNTPAALYGMTMNSVENAMGYTYTIGSMYSDVLDIDPVEMCAYFYQRFLHISDMDGIDTVIQNNFAKVILPEDVTAALSADYSQAKIQAKIDQGVAYYNNNPSKFAGAVFAKIGMDPKFTDVPESEWYSDGVAGMVSRGLFEGIGTAFEPTRTMSMAELVQVLYRVANGKEPTASSPWYETAKNWAITEGLVTAASFDPTAGVTRQDFFLMYYRYIENTGKADMTLTADLTVATDYAKLDEKNLSAISWCVGAGMVKGISTSNLTIDPDAVMDRGTVCTMLDRYYDGVETTQSAASGGQSRG